MVYCTLRGTTRQSPDHSKDPGRWLFGEKSTVHTAALWSDRVRWQLHERSATKKRTPFKLKGKSYPDADACDFENFYFTFLVYNQSHSKTHCNTACDRIAIYSTQIHTQWVGTLYFFNVLDDGYFHVSLNISVKGRLNEDAMMTWFCSLSAENFHFTHCGLSEVTWPLGGSRNKLWTQHCHITFKIDVLKLLAAVAYFNIQQLQCKIIHS